MQTSQSASILARARSVHPAVYWSILSGMAALIYQVVLQKIFSYLLGGALLSTTIVVAAYMAGLALGGFFAGLFSDRLSQSRNQILYGCIEAAIAVCGVGSLLAYTVYLAKLSALIANPAIVSLLSSIPFRAVASLAALLPMTILMGATLPVLAMGIQATTGQREKTQSAGTVSLSSLYSANLLGGMAGVLISAYLVMPEFGLGGATLLACVANLTIAALVFRFRAAENPERGNAELDAAIKDELGTSGTPSFAMVCFLGFSSGLVMFALEIVWTHLLATVIGSSVYAFSNMLLAVFAALYFAARREERPDAVRTPLSRLVLLASILLAVSVPFYAFAPILFSIVGLGAPGFFVREVARVAVACLLIVPVGLLLSRIFPRLLAVGIPADRKGRGVGFLLSINTFGCLLGLFLGNFVLIPVLGSEFAMKGMAVLLGLIAWAVYVRGPKGSQAPSLFRYKVEFALLAVAVLAIAVPSWPPSLLLSNRNTYFGLMPEGDFQSLLYLGEDAESGFVSVSRNSGGNTELRTNGKFQGDNGPQMSAQFSFGYLPALAAPRHEKAFVVGCGTGVTVRALADTGFKQIQLAELSRPILYAARTYFHDANGGILDDPRVTVIHDDGRNALALSGEKYDVISVELTSVWFAGAANLYSSDFYSIVHQKLEPGGVFQQWVQFHHMRLEDLYVLLNTVHTRFKYVALWSGGGQGQLLASDEPLSLDWQRMRALAASHPDARYITTEEIYRIPFRILLDSDGLQSFVSDAGLKALLGHGLGASLLPAPLGRLRRAQFVDSDLYPYLEYATPRGNATVRQELLIPAYLAQQADKPVSVPLRNVPAADVPLAQAMLAYQNGTCDEVGRLLESGAAVRAADDMAFLRTCKPNLNSRVLDLH